MADAYFENIALESIPCPNGCVEDDKLIVSGYDLLCGLPGEFTVVQCKQCGLMRTNPRPTAATIGYYYPDNYGPYAGTRITKNDNSGIAFTWKKKIDSILSTKGEALPNTPPGNLLEVGCASGSFLYKMEQIGWNVEGIEFSEKASENARSHGYKVTTGSLESAQEPDKKYDLIVAWMVIEHLHDPKGSLEKLNKWTEKNGFLVFSIPNSSRLFMNKYSYNLQLPTHLFHFTPDTITALLKKTGWHTERIIHQVTLSSLMASAGYWLRETRGESKLSRWLVGYPTKSRKLHLLFYPLAYLLAKFGQTGRMTIWARKADD
ncbi:class I SAM-dependent methyltransferase [Thiolapillus sp.]